MGHTHPHTQTDKVWTMNKFLYCAILDTNVKLIARPVKGAGK